MNIKNLSIGQTIKNYKELCSIIEEKVRTGNSKKAHLKELESLCDYHKKGNSFIIDEIYQTPKEVPGRKIYGNTSIYGEDIKVLMLNLLVQSNTGNILLPTCEILKELKMTNNNYSYGMRNMKQLSKKTNIEQIYIQDFYNHTHNSMKSALESALNILQKEALIYWTKSLVLCYSGNDDSSNSIKSRKYIVASDDEIKKILKEEKDVLKEMNFSSTHQIVQCGKWKEFITETNKRIYNKYNILYFYKAYKILSNKSQVIEELKTIEKVQIENSLNQKLVINLQKNSKQRYNRAIKEKTKTKDWGTQSMSKYKEIKSTNEYMSNMYLLIENLVNINNNTIYAKEDKQEPKILYKTKPK